MHGVLSAKWAWLGASVPEVVCSSTVLSSTPASSTPAQVLCRALSTPGSWRKPRHPEQVFFSPSVILFRSSPVHVSRSISAVCSGSSALSAEERNKAREPGCSLAFCGIFIAELLRRSGPLGSGTLGSGTLGSAGWNQASEMCPAQEKRNEGTRRDSYGRQLAPHGSIRCGR